MCTLPSTSACQCGCRPRLSLARADWLSRRACLTVPLIPHPSRSRSGSGPAHDQTSTKHRDVCASLPPFAVVTNILKDQGFASCRRLRPFIQRALSRRKQGFESPRERQCVRFHFDFPLLSAAFPKPAEAVWAILFALCPSSLITASSARPA